MATSGRAPDAPVVRVRVILAVAPNQRRELAPP
jgi:hypothetical protein